MKTKNITLNLGKTLTKEQLKSVLAGFAPDCEEGETFDGNLGYCVPQMVTGPSGFSHPDFSCINGLP